MFQLSAGEIIVIALLALIFFGPHGCADMVRKIGQWVGKIQKTFRDGQDQL